MTEEMQNKLDELINLINNDSRIIEMKELRTKLLTDTELMEQIKKYQLDPIKYQNLKMQIYANPDYKRYQQLENDIYFLTLSINLKLNILTDKRRCHR